MVEDGTEFGFEASRKRDNWVTRQVGAAMVERWQKGGPSNHDLQRDTKVGKETEET